MTDTAQCARCGEPKMSPLHYVINRGQTGHHVFAPLPEEDAAVRTEEQAPTHKCYTCGLLGDFSAVMKHGVGERHVFGPLAAAPPAPRAPRNETTTDQGWNDTAPKCPECGNLLKGHWRGRACLTGEGEAPTRDTPTRASLEAALHTYRREAERLRELVDGCMHCRRKLQLQKSEAETRAALRASLSETTNG